jgi:hypothetical protein
MQFNDEFRMQFNDEFRMQFNDEILYKLLKFRNSRFGYFT